MNLFNLTKKFHEHSDGIIAKQQKAYMKPKKEIFKWFFKYTPKKQGIIHAVSYIFFVRSNYFKSDLVRLFLD